jgi:hypothetical protein
MPKWIGGIENTSGVSKSGETKKNAPPSSPESDLPAEEFSTDMHEYRLEKDYQKDEPIEGKAPTIPKSPPIEKPKR